MIIDGHQHFWKLNRADYGWLTPDLKPLYRDFLPTEYDALRAEFDIAGSVVAQAAPTVAETEYLLELSEQHSYIRGVVGWIDFESPTAPQDLRRLARNPRLVGLRPMIQDIADDDWMLNRAFDPVFAVLQERDLVFEALTLPRHLSRLDQLLRRHPDLRCVIDHGSKPTIRDGGLRDWSAALDRLAERPGTLCKFSGLITEAGSRWTIDALRPYARQLLSSFGADRLIWGSDWPVCLLAGSFGRWLDASRVLLSEVPAAEQEGIFGKNAIRCYRLNIAGYP